MVQLIHRFYALARPRIRNSGRSSNNASIDWDGHLSHLVDFWSTLLRGTRRFNGRPMQRHMPLPGLTPALFHRWLALFAQMTAELGNPALKATADMHARSMAERFWQKYRIQGYDILDAATGPSLVRKEEST